MILQSLSLTNFRNYSKADFTFSPTTTLILGPNAVGKTNLLEAIYYLASGKSFRAGYDREAIAQGAPFANLKSQISNLKYGEEKELELQILANENGENTSSKRFKVNGVKKRRADFAGNLRAVCFGPEEILLVTGSPSRRRKYLDSVLVQVDRDYARALSEYEKVVRQRNRLLLLIREGEPSFAKASGGLRQLNFWDEKMLALGSVLTKKRQEMFGDFNAWLKDYGLFLLFEPRPWLNKKDSREREIAAGMTLRGPHRDDFGFLKSGSEQLRKLSESAGQNFREPKNQSVGNSDVSGTLTHRRADAPSYSEFSDLSSFGSRGEQRLAVLHLKLAELEFISERTGDRPLLLLDDIFSELDEDNRGSVLELLGKQQTIVTATDLDQIDGEKLGDLEVLRLQ